MNEIKKIIIENFQSHEYTELNFEKGLNAITGPSDSGKSSVIRAIKWVLYNEPRGNEFIRQGSKGSKVKILFTNGFEIIRERTTYKNKYLLISPDGQETTYEGFGNEVPLEIINGHGIDRVSLDLDIKSGINMSDQMEGPFLISENNSVKAKAIGSLVGVNVLDIALKDCLGDIRKESVGLEKLISSLEEIDSKLIEFGDLKSFEQSLALAEDNIKNLEQKEVLKLKLEEFTLSINQIENNKFEQKIIMDNFKDIEKKENIFLDIKLKFNNYKNYKNIRNRINTSESEIVLQENVINKIDFIEESIEISNKVCTKWENYHRLMILNDSYKLYESDLKKIDNTLKKLEDIQNLKYKNELIIQNYDKFIKLKNIEQKLKKLEVALIEGQNYFNEKQVEIEFLYENYAKILKKLNKCPICGHKIDQNIINHIKEL